MVSVLGSSSLRHFDERERRGHAGHRGVRSRELREQHLKQEQRGGRRIEPLDGDRRNTARTKRFAIGKEGDRDERQERAPDMDRSQPGDPLRAEHGERERTLHDDCGGQHSHDTDSALAEQQAADEEHLRDDEQGEDLARALEP
jgi:hypothetical protein